MAIQEYSGSPHETLEQQWERAQVELRALGAAVGSITEEVRELGRREVVLARTEMAENTGYAARGASWGGAGAVFGLIALSFTALGLMFGLATWMPLWLAAVVTALVFGFVAALFGAFAMKNFKQFSLVPKRTIESLQEDVRWAREQMRRRET